MSWLLSFIASLLSRIFKDWRRDEELKQSGRVEQQNADMKAADKRRADADQIRSITASMTDEELEAALRGDDK